MRNRIEVARIAQQRWDSLSMHARIAALRNLRHAINSRLDPIVEVISSEVGKPAMDALTGDVLVTLEHLRYYERHAARILRSRSVGKPAFLFTGTRFQESFEPYGVALIIAPWNYPLQLALVPALTALFAGNSVVLKCSERTPETAALIASLCRDAGLPEDLVQICVDSPEATRELIKARPDIIFFTGSSENGRIVAQQAAELLIPAVLELGGKDACLVFDSCDLARTVEGVCYGAFSNAGQVCIGVKRIYVQQSIHDEFVSRLVARSRQVRIGRDKQSDIGLIQFDFVRERLAKMVDDATSSGAVLHTEWDRSSGRIPPLVLTGVRHDAQLLTEESFGPVVCIEPFKDEEEAVRLGNSSVFSLSASIFTADDKQANRVAARLNSGTCTINDSIRNVGNPYAAFGGNNGSGYGRYHGAPGLHAFSRTKTVMKINRPKAREIHWFPFQEKTYNRLRAMLRFRHSRDSAMSRIMVLFKLLLFVCSFSTIYANAAEPNAAPLVIDVLLPANPQGSVAYLVFNSADGFPSTRDKALRHGFSPLRPREGHQLVDVGVLPAGRYAVALYLDINGNHRLDKGFLGIPKEPVGASNNPPGRRGPPHFEDCVFTHDGDAQKISITLVK